MSSVPLDHPIVVQEEITSSSVEILEVIENYPDQTVNVKVKTSQTPIVYDFFRVWGPDDYNIDWTQSDLEQAIVQHYDALNAQI